LSQATEQISVLAQHFIRRSRELFIRCVMDAGFVGCLSTAQTFHKSNHLLLFGLGQLLDFFDYLSCTHK